MFMSGSEEIFDAIGRYFKTEHEWRSIDTIRSQEHDHASRRIASQYG